VKDRTTWWTGVVNALARQHLRNVKKGDTVWLYHTGKEKAIVGSMRVTQGPCPEEGSEDPKSVMVQLAPGEKLPKPVTLQAMKADAIFADWALIRIGRLSVMPVPLYVDARIVELANAT
jgi:predicted RNA-binding protein with PUA-like domain